MLWSEIVKEWGVVLAAYCDIMNTPPHPNLLHVLVLHKAFIFCFEARFWKVEIDCKDPSLRISKA